MRGFRSRRGFRSALVWTPTVVLVRIAALAAIGAPPASYLLNLEAASELGSSLEDVQGALIAIAPVIGSGRVACAGARLPGASDSPPRSPKSRKWRGATDPDRVRWRPRLRVPPAPGGSRDAGAEHPGGGKKRDNNYGEPA